MTKDVWLKRVALVVLMTILTAISSATWAEENDSAVKALSLRIIMQEETGSPRTERGDDPLYLLHGFSTLQSRRTCGKKAWK